LIGLISGLIKRLERLQRGRGRLAGEFDRLTFKIEPDAVAFQAEILEAGAAERRSRSGHRPIMASPDVS
jgi:hypothetical protein